MDHQYEKARTVHSCKWRITILIDTGFQCQPPTSKAGSTKTSTLRITVRDYGGGAQGSGGKQRCPSATVGSLKERQEDLIEDLDPRHSARVIGIASSTSVTSHTYFSDQDSRKNPGEAFPVFYYPIAKDAPFLGPYPAVGERTGQT